METPDTDQDEAVAWWNALPAPVRMHWFRASGHRTATEAYRAYLADQAGSSAIVVASCPRCGYPGTK